MDRVGLVTAHPRLRFEARYYGGPVALLAAATLAVVVVRATAVEPHQSRTGATPAHARPSTPRLGAVRSTQVAFYFIRPGDTLGAVAARQRTSVGRLLALNQGIDPTALHAGDRVRVR